MIFTEVEAGESCSGYIINWTRTVRSMIPYWLLVVAGLGIFAGCIGKSAQFPLQTWLPDAMEGPTPVSALVHSATMVAAGVYLAARFYPMFTPEVLLVIAYIGCITLFLGATIAIVATDIKRVLAYSTISQLGYMMLALGLGGWIAGLFHLVTHAFFKSLMFLCSGSVIHGCHHEQEMTKMGGLWRKMPWTAFTMLIGVIAICGLAIPGFAIPGFGAIAFSGYHSKDAIIATGLAFISQNPQHFLLFLVPLITAGITAFYMFRMWYMTFAGAPRDKHRLRPRPRVPQGDGTFRWLSSSVFATWQLLGTSIRSGSANETGPAWSTLANSDAEQAAPRARYRTEQLLGEVDLAWPNEHRQPCLAIHAKRFANDFGRVLHCFRRYSAGHGNQLAVLLQESYVDPAETIQAVSSSRSPHTSWSRKVVFRRVI